MIEDLRKEGFMVIDMHFHTTYSDGTASPEWTVQRCKQLGIGIAISDHNLIRGSQLAYDMKKINVIPAIEVTSKQAHDILLYFNSMRDLEEFHKKIESKRKNNLFFNLKLTTLSNEEIIDYGRDYNALISLAHPYAYYPKKSARYFDKGLIKELDAVEVINGLHSNRQNDKALKLAVKHKTGMTAGSDGHVRSALGNCYTYSLASNIEEFLENIRKKENEVFGQRSNLLPFLASRFAVVHKNLFRRQI